MSPVDVPPHPERLHPMSPVAAAIPVLPGALLMFIVAGGGGAYRVGVLGVPLAVILATVATVAYGAYRYVAWTRTTYYFDESGDLRVDSGVLYRNQRRLQLSRLQSVDVVAPLVARLFGLASLRIEVAGSGDSRAVLAYLAREDAERLRVDILNRAAGLGNAAAKPSADETVLATVPVTDLVTSLILRTETVALWALTIGVIGFTYWTQGFGGLLLIPITGGLPVLMVVSEFLVMYGFTVANAGDGVRLRHGLLQTTAQTIPPGRVQAVDFVEPFLWRRMGWVRVRLTIAGAAGVSEDGQARASSSTLMPVAPWPVAKEIFGRVVPGVDLDAIDLHSVDRRARWRSPLQWRQLGYGFSDDVFVTRRGWLTRHLSVMPHARTQSVRVTQGPYSRWLGLATVAVDIAPGPVKVEAMHRSAASVRTIAEGQLLRAKSARARDTSIHWGRQRGDSEPIAGKNVTATEEPPDG